MFDFEKLLVYQKAKLVRQEIKTTILNKKLDAVDANQLKRAALSIPLNIAEGTSRYSKADRRNFYVIARGSATECVAVLDMLRDEKIISSEEFKHLYIKLEELSKMLYALIQKLA